MPFVRRYVTQDSEQNFTSRRVAVDVYVAPGAVLPGDEVLAESQLSARKRAELARLEGGATVAQRPEPASPTGLSDADMTAALERFESMTVPQAVEAIKSTTDEVLLALYRDAEQEREGGPRKGVLAAFEAAEGGPRMADPADEDDGA